MPKVSVNILTYNRSPLLKKALASVSAQSFADFEIVVVNDGSTDSTPQVLDDLKNEKFKIISHASSQGITFSRQDALLKSSGEYIAILDDDDEWLDADKLKKQVEYLDKNPRIVLVGGGIQSNSKKFRPVSDTQIRKTMLLRNNFFTSTVMFRRQEAIEAGGFIKDNDDLAEDYDLWLRLGQKDKMYNFHEVFTAYTPPSYNRERFKRFLAKQLRLIEANKTNYPNFRLASLILKMRLLF